ncbi:hypothetical protein BKA70DRAFT_1227581 [Coprinopsis sp. MPI-PUGE-AT-0042]|nr:hypothetical protein BKA70DRAFT_1227581 [Coprinopsis sp. MPI-PUGE-AT-0042]
MGRELSHSGSKSASEWDLQQPTCLGPFYQPQHTTTDIHTELLSPIDDLPDEVLAYIFWVALPSILDGPARLKLTILRLVCQRWNAIALATPSFWRGVSIQHRDRPIGASRCHISDLEGTVGLWFQRGGDNAPCTLHVDRFAFPWLLDRESFTEFLASPWRSWRELSFPIDAKFISNLKDRLRENGGGGWKRLERLEMYQMDTSFYDIPSVPSVQSLHLADASALALEDPETGRLLEPPSTGGVVYRSLTSLHISRCYIYDSLTFAKFISPTSFPRVRVLVLDSLDYAYEGDPFDSMLGEPTRPHTCKHEGIEHLTSIGSETAAVLVNLHLPSLKVWRLERVTPTKHSKHPLDTANGWYQSFAEHSTDNLHTLDLGDSCMLPSQVAALLEKIPSVKKLYVQDCQFLQYLVKPRLTLVGIDEIVAIDPLPTTPVADRNQAPGSGGLSSTVVERRAGEGAFPPGSHWYPQPEVEVEGIEAVGSAMTEEIKAWFKAYLETGVMPDPPSPSFKPFGTQNESDNEEYANIAGF